MQIIKLVLDIDNSQVNLRTFSKANGKHAKSQVSRNTQR